MALDLMEILSWKNKQDSATIFLSLNLVFYLIVLGGYSLLSIASFVFLGFLAVINLHSFACKTRLDDDDYLYFTRESLEELFIKSYEALGKLNKKIHKSIEDSIQLILCLLIFNWLIETFGSACFLWFLVILAFMLTPQYYSNKPLIDSHLAQLTSKAKEVKQTVFDIIPKYKTAN